MTDHFPDATKKVDFILREDAVQCAEDVADDLFGEGAYEGARIVAERLKDIPAADVVEVVRCRDCGHYIAYRLDCGLYALEKATD
jgi:hypothetical protein